MKGRKTVCGHNDGLSGTDSTCHPVATPPRVVQPSTRRTRLRDSSRFPRLQSRPTEFQILDKRLRCHRRS